MLPITCISRFPSFHGWRGYKKPPGYLGFIQKDVSERVGISQAALSQMESGEKRLRMVTLEKLAAAISIGVEQLR